MTAPGAPGENLSPILKSGGADMAESHVLSGLVAKRGELAGEVEATLQRMMDRRAAEGRLPLFG